MMNNILFGARQCAKRYMQVRYLPSVYERAAHGVAVERGKVIFADYRHGTVPESMRLIRERVRRGALGDVRIVDMFTDLSKCSAAAKLRFMEDFMKEYATAELVFICDYFLPVSSCRKRDETKVVQLWHSGGLLKKMGADTYDDIPKGYGGSVTDNYNLVTVSSEVCVPVWQRAMGLEDGVVRATGISRTDRYFSDAWKRSCSRKVYEAFPEARGRRLAVYAPSFSGNAAMPVCRGLDDGTADFLMRLNSTQKQWYFVVSPHPGLKVRYPRYFKGLRGLTTSMLLPETQLLITDYSSVLFDYSIYRKPFLLYVPDMAGYERTRGFYVNPEDFPCDIVRDRSSMRDYISQKVIAMTSESGYNYTDFDKFYSYHMQMCDGHATDRILDAVRDML